jgi:hypothetical protein
MKLHQIFKAILLISDLNSLKLANLHHKWSTTVRKAAELKISRISQSAGAFHRVAADCFYAAQGSVNCIDGVFHDKLVRYLKTRRT